MAYKMIVIVCVAICLVMGASGILLGLTGAALVSDSSTLSTRQESGGGGYAFPAHLKDNTHCVVYTFDCGRLLW